MSLDTWEGTSLNLNEFLQQLRAQIQAEISQRLAETGGAYPYPESVFAEVVMDHMADIAMTFEPRPCHYARKNANSNLRISGFAMSEGGDELDLFVSLFADVDRIETVSDAETLAAVRQCESFLTRCVNGSLLRTMDASDDAYELTLAIHECYPQLEQIRIYVLTDRQAKSKNFKAREINGKTVKLEVMDIERLYRHLSEGKPRDELIVNFLDTSGTAIPCVYVPGESDYDYALAAIPAEALRTIYEKYGARLLEANVRSFLSAAGKVNKGITGTLRDDPERFMAYNNGIVVVADEVALQNTQSGAPGIASIKGMRIVNGGQTTASVYFSKKKFPEIDLRRVRVPAKIIILRPKDGTDGPALEEALIADISRYANSQNAVRQSDLSANRPFHVEIEKHAQTTYCPDGVGRWFYERAAGSYNTMLAREGSTPAKLKQLKEKIVPPARKITKTDLAKYINAWGGRPDIVSRGLQKNFEDFMDQLNVAEGAPARPLPTVSDFKSIIAKAIIFKRTSALVRPMFPAFQANVCAYVVALLSVKLGERFELEKVWAAQDISQGLKGQIQVWAREVNDVLYRTAAGRMVSEWAKKPECWTAVKMAAYSPHATNITELVTRSGR
jgi:hypothetical protein